MRPADLLKISSTNLDHLTETYNIGFYLEYLTKWPDLCRLIEGVDGKIEGYSALRSPIPLNGFLLRLPTSERDPAPRTTPRNR
jgi:N-terminal acetyltransferase B complex catalytic subunit